MKESSLQSGFILLLLLSLEGARPHLVHLLDFPRPLLLCPVLLGHALGAAVGTQTALEKMSLISSRVRRKGEETRDERPREDVQESRQPLAAPWRPPTEPRSWLARTLEERWW